MLMSALRRRRGTRGVHSITTIIIIIILLLLLLPCKARYLGSGLEKALSLDWKEIMLAQKRILHRATSVLFPRGGTVLSPPAAVRTLSTSCRPWPNATALGPSSTAVASDKKGPTLSTFVSALHAHNTSSSTIADSRRPLFQLDRALLPGLAPSSSSPDTPNAPRPTLTWTINDAGAEECWAIVGPASERGGKVKRALVEVRVSASFRSLLLSLS